MYMIPRNNTNIGLMRVTTPGLKLLNSKKNEKPFRFTDSSTDGYWITFIRIFASVSSSLNLFDLIFPLMPPNRVWEIKGGMEWPAHICRISANGFQHRWKSRILATVFARTLRRSHLSWYCDSYMVYELQPRHYYISVPPRWHGTLRTYIDHYVVAASGGRCCKFISGMRPLLSIASSAALPRVARWLVALGSAPADTAEVWLSRRGTGPISNHSSGGWSRRK